MTAPCHGAERRSFDRVRCGQNRSGRCGAPTEAFHPIPKTQGGALMHSLRRAMGAVALVTIVAGTAIARADDDDAGRGRNAYQVTPLVSNLGGAAATGDPVLQNAWGIAFSPAGSPFWVN